MTSNSQSPELSKFLASIDGFDNTSFANENDRYAALAAARALCTKIEKPWDTAMHQCWSMPCIVSAAKIGMQLKLFEALDADEGTPKTSSSLANTVGAEEDLVSRLLRLLASNGLVRETAPDTWGPTPYTSAFKDRRMSSNVDFAFDTMWRMLPTLPEYLEKTNYKTPRDASDGPWQYATKTDLTYFGYLGEHPQIAKNFSDLMAGYTADRENWVDVYPTEQLIPDGETSEEVLIVDVGGNIGSDLERFLDKHPNAKGRLVVQDLEHIVNGGNVHERIVPMAHDFLTEQPVKGARAYFFHSIFHDWPDDICLRILAALKPAVGRDSKLLISENVIPPTGAAPHQTALDWIVMAALGAGERSEDMWRQLLEKGGFTVTKIYPGRLESVIEAVAT